VEAGGSRLEVVGAGRHSVERGLFAGERYRVCEPGVLLCVESGGFYAPPKGRSQRRLVSSKDFDQIRDQSHRRNRVSRYRGNARVCIR